MEVDNHSPPGESDTFAGSTSLENVAENPVDPAAGNQTITSKSDSAEGTGDDEINVATTITKDAKSTNKKSSRKRKKHIFNNIRQTMEFYFSDANLSKDRFLMRLIETNPEVPLVTFMAFNKIKAMVSTVEEIEKAISTSELLRLSEDRTAVARRADLASLQTRCPDDCTIYVEALPTTATHDWVRKIFEPYGTVAYVSLPKYRTSQHIKEFAFVEFEQRASVLRAMTAFAEFGGALNAAADPEKLGSIMAFLREQNGCSVDEEGTNVDVQKKKGKAKPKKEPTKQDDTVGDFIVSTNQRDQRARNVSTDSAEPKTKKTRLDTAESVSTEADDVVDDPAGPDAVEMNEATEQSDAIAAGDSPDTDERKTNDVDLDADDDDDDEASKGGIKVRRKKTTAKHQHPVKATVEVLRLDASIQSLRITTKLEWKRLRNKYLNQQREKVKQMKKQWWQNRQQGAAKSDVQREHSGGNINFYGGDKNRKTAVLAEVVEGSQSALFAKRSDKNAGGDIEMAGSSVDAQPTKKQAANDDNCTPEAIVKAPLFSFEPGIIVRVAFSAPCVDVKDFKAEMRQHSCVRYVDVREGDLSAFVRIDGSDSAGDLCTRAAPLQCEVLHGDAETAYWQKIHTDRHQKLTKQLKVKPKRGREKVKASAAAAAAVLQANHVRFDD